MAAVASVALPACTQGWILRFRPRLLQPTTSNKMSTKPKISLCEKCQQPFHGDISKENIAFFDHHQTWDDVNAAAENGCYMCSWYIQKWPTSQEASINGDTSLRMMCGIFPPDKMSIDLIRKDLAALNFDCYRKDGNCSPGHA